MSRAKDLLKNTGILMIAKISTQLVNVLLLPLYTVVLSTAEYGEIDIYTSLVMIIVPFLTLQLEMGLFRYYIIEKNEKNKTAIISTSFTVVGLILVIVSIIYWGIMIFFPIKYFAYVYSYFISMAIYTVFLQVCRAFGNNKVYGFASFIGSSFSVFLNVVFVLLLGFKVEGVLLASSIAHIVSSIYMIFRTRVYSVFSPNKFDKASAKLLLNYSVPLVFNQISSWGINYSDRLIILGKWGIDQNGIYSLANKFSDLSNMFFGVFNVAWTENVVRSMDDDSHEEYISKMFRLIFTCYLFVVTSIITVLPFAFKFINADYSDAYYHIPILLAGAFLSGMSATIGSIYIAHGKTKEVSITTLLAGLSNIIVHLALLNTCRLFAASISTLVSFFLLFLYRIVFVKKFFKLNIQYKSIAFQLLYFLIISLVFYSTNMMLIIFGAFLNVITIIVALYRYKDILIKMIRK